MRQRRKVARCADGALAGDHRGDALAQHVLDHGEGLPGDARGAAPGREQLQRHHQPSGGNIQRLADAAAMRQDQVALQLRRIARLNADAGELAETGVDAVNRLVAGGGGADQFSGSLDARQRAGIKLHGDAGAPDLFNLVKRCLSRQ